MTLRDAGSTLVVAACVVALATVPTVPPAAGTAASPATGSLGPLAAQQDVEADTVRLHVAVEPDGTAEWAVEYRIHLADDDRVEAFESLRSDLESNPRPYVAQFTDVLAPSVARAENQTGREMALRNVTVSAGEASISRPVGVVTYRFEWTGFADVRDDRLVVGDALGGFYVDDSTTLRIEWPDGYEAASVTPDPSDRSDDAAVWHGPTDFGDDEPRVVLEPTGLDLPTPVVALLALVVVATLGIAGRFHGSGEGDGDATAAAGPAGDDAPPMELLSNEERVIAVLEDNGGRLKQQAIAEELDWGSPKTSRVVNDLREEEAVEVFRIGRENVVTLPEEGLL